jgi:hypothetical protein
VADGGGLENRYGVTPIVGSNPTPSAVVVVTTFPLVVALFPCPVGRTLGGQARSDVLSGRPELSPPGPRGPP